MDYTHRLLSSGRTYKFALFFLGSLVGGYAGGISILLPAVLCLPFALAGLIYSWFSLAEDSKRSSMGKAEKSILRKIWLSLKESLRSPSIGLVYLITFSLGLGTFGLFIYWQITLNEVAGWGTDMMGLFFSLVSLSIIVGCKVSSSVRPGWREAGLIMLSLCALLAFAAYTQVPLLLAASILVWEAVFGLYQPIEGTIISHNTKPAIRATVMSVNALSFRLGWVVLGALVAFAPPADPRHLWYAGAVFFLLAAALAAYGLGKRLPAGEA